MSLSEEQCKKVCRILDDVLANRPTERDSLIVATRNAFSALSEPHWIPVTERLPNRDELVLVTYKTTDKIQIRLCMYFDDGSENPWWSYIDACCLWNNTILAWMPLPEPYKEVTDGRD